MKTYKFNITKSLSYLGKVKLNTLSNEHRLTYNHLLGCAQDPEIGSDFKKLNDEYRDFRNDNNLTIPSKSAQNTWLGLKNNILSYYALRKTDATAKFPHKFKSWKFFTSFTYDWNGGGGGFYIEDNILVLKQQRKKFLEIPLPEYLKDEDISDIRTITFSMENNVYSLSIVVGSGAEPLPFNGNWMSIDPGCASIITAVTSDGQCLQYTTTKFDHLYKSVNHLKSKRDKKGKVQQSIQTTWKDSS